MAFTANDVVCLTVARAYLSELVKQVKKVLAFKNAIIAVGSQAVRLPLMPQDPRVVDSASVPKKLLIVGGGIIGLMQGAERDLVKVWEKMNAKRFDKIMLKTKTVGAQATLGGIQLQFEGLDRTKSAGLTFGVCITEAFGLECRARQPTD
jgi:hypothetical protein